MGCEATKRGDVRDAGELSKLMVAPALCGNPMPNPAAAPPLTSQQVTTIGDWIDQGANP